jgi:hypothetical protein
MSKKFFLFVLGLFTSAALVGQIQLTSEEKSAINTEANKLIKRPYETVTNNLAPNTTGGKHDYYSEAPYWWPDPKNPTGPYIRRDGERNPENFTKHSEALTRLNTSITILTAAYLNTSDAKYSTRATEILKSWFVDTATMMNPNLLYSQAIKGVNKGRAIGIIDGVKLINVAISAKNLIDKGAIKGDDAAKITKWFSTLNTWLTTHEFGMEEKNNNNNHSTWWAAQVAAYASLTGDKNTTKIAIETYKAQLEIQLGKKGDFPEEIGRTRPFHYQTYNINAWALLGLFTNKLENSIIAYKSKNGTLTNAYDFMYEVCLKPETWGHATSLEKTIEPKAEPYLYLASFLTKNNKYQELWSKLPKDKVVFENSEMMIYLNML